MSGDKTELARYKFYQRKKLTDEDIMRLQADDRKTSLIADTILKIVKSWYTYLTVLITGALAELTNLINWVD